MQTQNPNLEHCLVSLTLDHKPSHSATPSSIMGSITSSPPSSTLVGDYLGIESCLDLKENDDVFTSASSLKQENGKSDSLRQRHSERDERRGKVKKEFPPPIPLLARTENLTSHMPWVLKRYYTSDGRLILREERVKHHEYFRAQRCNGRLILQLVALDDEVCPPCFAEDEEEDTIDCSSEEEEEEEEEEKEDIKVKEIDNEKIEQEEEVVVNEEQRNSVIGGNVSGFKCFNYNSMRQGSTCIFEMPVPAMRPVHS